MALKLDKPEYVLLFQRYGDSNIFNIFLKLLIKGGEGKTEMGVPINILNNINNDSMMNGALDVYI